MSIFKRLQSNEVTITPFKAHKKFTQVVDNVDSGSGVSVVEGVNYNGHFYPTEEKNSNGIWKRSVYHLVNKLHYAFENDPATTFTNNTREVLEKNYITNAEDVPFPTHTSASITHILIPQKKMGERIKPGTFKITSKSGSLDGEIFKDDSIGNLYSTTDSASWHSSTSASYWPPSASLKGYWKFDNSDEPFIDYSGNGNTAEHSGSAWTTYYDSGSSIEGLAIKKDPTEGNSGVRLLPHKRLYGQNQQTWTLWFKPDGHENGDKLARIITRDASEYFALYEKGDYSTDGKCKARFFSGNGINTEFNNALISGSWHFAAISVNYTEASQSVYLWNGEDWFSDAIHTGGVGKWDGSNTGSYRNSYKRAVVLGCNSENQTKMQVHNNNFSGSYDEVRYYDTNLSEAQIHCLKDFPRGRKSSWIGDVWYEAGGAVVKTQDKYRTLALGTADDGFDLEWDATVQIFEHEYRCTTKVDEFNKTINQSIIAESLDRNTLIGTATHSLFAPYVTTIGLYDQNYALLAIGKLGKPIKTSVETPMTFVVRIDL